MLRILPAYLAICFLVGMPPHTTAQEAVSQAATAAAPLTNNDVVSLLKAGVAPEPVIAKIRASRCEFDTAPEKLKDLKSASIPDSVVLAMIEAPNREIKIDTTVKAGNSGPLAQPMLSSEILAERAHRESYCPKCKFLLISNVDSRSGAVTDDWLSKHQIEFMKHKSEEVKQGKHSPTFLYTKHRENADYILFWTAAQGFRPYVTYVPHTVTETGNVSGNYNNYGAYGSNFGSFDGTVTVNRTYYTAQAGQWNFTDVELTVYDRDGKKIYASWHRGNFRWSKPDKDCLEDAFNYLRQLNP